MPFNLCKCFKRPRRKETDCYDIVIFKIGDHEFATDRVVLMARLEYFKNFFTENKQSTIELDPETINPTYFGDFLNYVYTFEINFTDENVLVIYKIAEYFRFNELMNKVNEHLENENADCFQIMAKEPGLNLFVNNVFEQFSHDLNEFTRTEMIPTLTFDLLKLFFMRMKSIGQFEEMLHYTVIWILGDESNRSGMLLELLRMIPLENFNSNFLKQVAYHYELIRKDNECLKLLFDAFKTSLRVDVKEERRQRMESLYAVGGITQMGGNIEFSPVSQYHHSTRKWIPVSSYNMSFFGCAAFGHKIYVCGGTNGKEDMSLLSVFDTYSQEWTQLTPMKHARQQCAAAVLNEQIYVAGGWSGTEMNGTMKSTVSAVVERYDVIADRWSDVAPMTTKRGGHELVALNGFLYAIGGHDGNHGLNIVERYDPQTDQWTQMNDTNNKYQSFGSAVLNGYIYIAGTTCEMYSPADDNWSEMRVPSKYSIGRRLAVYHGKLYAFGGSNEKQRSGRSEDIVEVYDKRADVWRREPDMDIGRAFHGVAVVERSFFDPMKETIHENESLNELRLQNTGCDIILEIGGNQFPAHRAVLIARMEYFRYMFPIHREIENETVIPLDPEFIDSKYFGEILIYIYTSMITFTNENMPPIYKAAKHLHFDELIYDLEEHMEFTVNIDNVRSYLPIVIELGLKSLQSFFAQFVTKQIFSDTNKRSRKKLVSTLLLEDLKEVLLNLEENGSIEDMFYHIVDWISEDEIDRSKMLLELLKRIPLQKLSSVFLIEVVSQNELIRKNSECLNWLLDAVITVPFSHNESNTDILYTVGGEDEQELSSVSQYNSQTGKWTATTPMSSKRISFGCAVNERKIYVCGGCDPNDRYRKKYDFTVFDTDTQTWTQLTPMKHAREFCAAAVLDGQVYVAGGVNDEDRLAVVERYNIETGMWSDIASMTTKRKALELIAYDEFLYAIGGSDDSSTLNSVERYDPQTDQWTVINHTNSGYTAFGSAVLNDNIYIAGGNQCEVYNKIFKRWIRMQAPSECTLSVRLAAHNGKLYAIGGLLGNEETGFKSSKTVEVYDFQTRVWRPEPDMDIGRCWHAVAVVKN